MNVKLIAHTKPVNELVSDEELVAYVARVSNPENQNTMQNSTKLLKYLADHKHWSPFEMVNVLMEIETTRDIARQILRHRSFSFQEFSQRYADPTQDLGFELRDARLQDKKNRQNSIDLPDNIVLDPKTLMNSGWLKDQWKIKQDHVRWAAQEAYEWAIEHNIAKEQARAVLPEGLTVSRMYMNGTLRSWIHYCQLRCANGTQKEHREIAVACWKQICYIYPVLETLIDMEM